MPTLKPETVELLNSLSPRDVQAIKAATDLFMLAGEKEPDAEKRITSGVKELREAYFLARNAKIGVKFVATVGAAFIASLQWGADMWQHIKQYLVFLGKGGG
jgi:hypothetical protein